MKIAIYKRFKKRANCPLFSLAARGGTPRADFTKKYQTEFLIFENFFKKVLDKFPKS
jgi:hypothetical protein